MISAQQRQAALDKISPEDLLKIQSVDKGSMKIEAEDLLEAEFALKFGWEAYKDYEANEISTNKFMKLIMASRKIDSREQLKMAEAAFIGMGAAQSRKPSQAFKSMTSGLVRNSEADK